MSIWKSESEDSYRLPPINQKDIEDTEKKLGFILPISYKRIILEQNGGYINQNAYPTTVPTNWADDHVNVEYIWGIGSDNSILQSDYYIQEWEMPEKILLLSGDGHTWICFDYRDTTENPPIIYIDNESEEIILLASDFETFLNGLYTETYEDIETPSSTVYLSAEEIEEKITILPTPDLFDLINSMNTMYDPNFVLTQYLRVIHHEHFMIRGAIAAGVYNIVCQNNMTDSTLLQKLIEAIRNDEEEYVRSYATRFEKQ
ncbi:SMI1/KNR4 family protein [Lysinibacillus sp. NPDC097287]|uniref:SMI1/KNR4 family protein n=1 Tax=Lysinibacillus sp. NPDC097287 TaxID=3364144 RepID=UPI00381B9D7B